MKAIHVDVRVKPVQYEVYMGTGLLGQMARDLREKPLARRYAVLSDDRVAGLYGEKMIEALEREDLRQISLLSPRGRRVRTGARKKNWKNGRITRLIISGKSMRSHRDRRIPIGWQTCRSAV